MIIRPKVHWLRMLFVWKGSVLPTILNRLLIVLALSIGVVLTHGVILSFKVQLNPVPFTLIGVSLALFLGFRNSASYERYWEGRKLWGALLNVARSLTRQVRSLTSLPPDDPKVDAFLFRLIAVVHTLRHQLRRSDPTADLDRLLGHEEAARLLPKRYRPAALVDSLGQWARERRLEGSLDPILAASIDQNLTEVHSVIGGCERIASTPIPVSYAVMIHRVVYIYCALLPFGLVDTLGWMTPVISVFVAYSFVALEELAAQLEDPFGESPNDLALTAMSRTIESAVRELAGKAPLPEEPVPSDFNVL